MMIVSGLQRPPLSRTAAWREVALTAGVLWLVLGGAAQSIYDRWGTSLNAAFVLDIVFLIGCLAVIVFVLWRQHRQGEGIAELGWGRPVRTPVIVIAVVYGLAWTAMSYMRGGDPLAFPWQRPIMMAVGLVLAFAEEIAVRGLILDRLARCGTSRLIQIVVTAGIMALYHGVVGHSVWPSYMVASFFLFGILSAIYVYGGRSLTPVFIAHVMTHFLGDPVLIQGILYGVRGG